ncbi:MAG: histidine phosphatase family protein [Magnetococcales bacterium]|nr:histidine phosphatase family protein [Magnetococcales bacterium]MBF0156248.1 histidine phosphatase family protein [Magnetococcales bacterium]
MTAPWVVPADCRRHLSQSLLFMRHGERDKILDAREAWRVPLTPRGVTESREMGRRDLAPLGPAHIFHSIVGRCRQTAEALHEGLVIAGAKTVNHGPDKRLTAPFLPNPPVSYAYAETEGLDSGRFLEVWFADQLPPSIAQPAREAAEEQMAFLEKSHETHGGFQIHVSHDWNILLLAWKFLGLSPDQALWPNFWEGLWFLFQPGEMSIHYRNHSRTIPRNQSVAEPHPTTGP